MRKFASAVVRYHLPGSPSFFAGAFRIWWQCDRPSTSCPLSLGPIAKNGEWLVGWGDFFFTHRLGFAMCQCFFRVGNPLEKGTLLYSEYIISDAD